MLDFQALKQAVSIDQVLADHGIVLRGRGHVLIGPCPVHRGSNPSAFRVHRTRGLWHCFTRCGGGTTLDLVAKLEGLTLYQAGLRLQQMAGQLPQAPRPRPCPSRQGNKPLGFELSLTNHPYLTEARDLRPATCAYFGLGYCGRGTLAGNVAIPIHDHQGRLVAYAGRSLEPFAPVKYRFPAGFRKSLVVYNAFRLSPACRSITVVEGFFDVFHLHQLGHPAVALMGSAASANQLDWLVNTGKPLTLIFDGDPAGRRGASLLASELNRRHHPFRVVTLEPEVQPEHLPADQLTDLLGTRMLTTPSSSL